MQTYFGNDRSADFLSTLTPLGAGPGRPLSVEQVFASLRFDDTQMQAAITVAGFSQLHEDLVELTNAVRASKP